MKKILLIILIIASAGNLFAQTFPVSLTTQSIPPHTGNISDWTAPGSNRLAVNIILADANEVNFQARLKVTIEGQGITLTSKNDFNATPINLRYGVPTQLNGPDLARVFHYENLNFQGYSLQQYEANGGLPDGSYQICFEVFDYDRIDEKPASMESCVMIFASLHKTPVVLAPIGLINPLYPQFVPIQWQARHNGAFPTQYTAEIYEYDENGGMTPELIVDFDQPFISKTVMAMSSAIVDISDPQLLPGKQYIIRVQAEDVNKQNGFKNQGWSDFEIFTYGENVCPAPFNIKVDQVSVNAAKITCDPIPGSFQNSYVLKYRDANSSDGAWYEDETNGTFWNLKNLKENTTYEYQVYTLCDGTFAGELSTTKTFTTPANELPVDCGDDYTPAVITNSDPALMLSKDMVITVADFKLYINSISNANGTWSGDGSLNVPWLNTYVNVAFENISVNTDLVVTDGLVRAVSNGINAAPGFVSAELLNIESSGAVISLCNAILPEDEAAITSGPLITTQAAGTGFNTSNLPFELYADADQPPIVIDSMQFTPNGGTLSAGIALKASAGGGNNRHLVFSGKSNFHIGGLSGTPLLFLEKDIDVQLQAKTSFSFLANNNSFVSWDCKGTTGINVEGTVAFCPELIIPFDESSQTGNASGIVSGTFTGTMDSWGDFVGTMNLPSFALTQKPDWKWAPTEVLFDYSDIRTPDAIAFPEKYQHADLDPSLVSENYPFWTGIFIKKANLFIPEGLTGAGQEVSINAQDILIDDFGFAAWVNQADVLSVDQGRMETWPYSIDEFDLAVQSSQFQDLSFKGKLKLPAFVETVSFDASLDAANEFFFDLDWRDTMTLDAFKADMILDPSSTIDLAYDAVNGKYNTEAILHGDATFLPSTPGGVDLNIPALPFEDFKLTTNAPYVEVGNWQMGGPKTAKFGNYTLTISEVGVARDSSSDEIVLGFKTKVHLTKASGGSLAGDGTFRIVGENSYDAATRKQTWGFKDFKIDELGIDASGTGYSFKGRLGFYDKDPTFGSGFRGVVDATFQPGLTVGAVAQFGAINNYNYFFADALVSFSTGKPIGTSGLMLFGFGGGVSYHMKREGSDAIQLPAVGQSPIPEQTNGLGISMSGIKYVPNKDVSVGVKAAVAVGTVNRTLFNGFATLEFLFNNSGGLDQIGFLGAGKFLTQPNQEPQLSCTLDMTYDFPSSAFHASLDMFVNVKNQIIGAYPNKLAGTGVLHIDPNDWYIHLGTPEKPLSLALNTAVIPKLDPLDISMGGYFDAGTILPAFPGLPSQVSSILGEYSVTKRDDPRFGMGRGMLFGANLKAEMKGLNYGIFYAGLEAGMGWDMMLYDYGENARCKGDELNPEPIGINGWYGSGQMYAYLQGHVGLHVDVFLYKGNINILNIGAAAALKARLPNPLYLKGVVGGHFSVLNGLVSGNCKFKFEAGEICEVVGADVLGIDIISDISPNPDENNDVDVFIRPEVTFTFNMGHIFSFYSEEEERMQMYRAMLDDFKIIKTSDGSVVPGEIVWSDDQGVLGFSTTDIFEPHTEYKLTVSVKVESRVLETQWETLNDTFGDPYRQTKEVTFTTGDAPNFIPTDNIAYSYPVNTQLNYLKAESGAGYVQLIQGQDYLFDGTNAGEWVRKMRLIQDGKIVQQFDIAYDANQNRINFSVPADNLANSTITQMAMVAIPTFSPAAIDANVLMQETAIVYGQDASATASDSDDFSTILLKQRTLENQSQNNNEEIMMTINFRTSRHNTLEEKINALTVTREWKSFTYFNDEIQADGSKNGMGINGFGIDWAGPELFDKFELSGYYNGASEFIPPLIELSADLSSTGVSNGKEWYDDEVFVNMSQYLPNASIPITWRDENVYGKIPSRALPMRQDPLYAASVLTEQNITSNSVSFFPTKTRMYYKVPYYLVRDYFQLRNDVALQYAHQNNPGMANFMTWDYPGPFAGDYKFNIKYKKPGKPAEGNISKSIHFNTDDF